MCIRDSYEAVADVTVATDGKNVTQICEEILAKLIEMCIRDRNHLHCTFSISNDLPAS